MTVPFTKAQIEDMMQRIFNQSREYFSDIGIHTPQQWLKEYGPDAVATAISSDRNIYTLYLETSGVDAYDVMDAYVNQQFAPETPNIRKPWNWNYNDIPGEAGAWSRQKADLTSEEAKSLWQFAIQRPNNKNRNEISEARRQLYIAYASDANLSDKIGIRKSELNKKMRNIAFVSVKQMQMEDSINKGVPEQFNWTGISNSSFLLRSKFTVDDIKKFVKSFSADNEETLKSNGDHIAKHVATTFLAINSHVSYDDLSVHLGKTSKKTTRGEYLGTKKMIVIDDNGPNTVAHEIGHYLDHKWGDEIKPGLCISDQSVVNTYSDHHLSESHQKWIEHFREFMRTLINESDLWSEYTQRFEEVFARFVGRFVGWVSNNPYTLMDTYGDKFDESDFREFVKLLQEKSYVDAEYKNNKTAGNTMIKKVAEQDETLAGDKESKMVVFNLPDTDRYTTDDYGINAAIQETESRISIGVYVTCYKIGVSGYQQYWHFKKQEKDEANKTYEQIKKVISETVAEIKEQDMPSMLIKSFLHRRLNKINRKHIEKMGVLGYNWEVTENDPVEDWRQSLYGNKYPKKEIDIIGIKFEQENKEVQTTGSSRSRRYYYKSSEFIERTVKTADLKKIMNINSDDKETRVRIPTNLIGQDVPINKIEVLRNNIWGSNETLKTAKSNMAPWFAVATLFGLVSGFELNNQLNQDKTQVAPQEQVEKTVPNSNKPVPRGIRNNNPGNIEMGKDKWLGSTKGDDSRFITFQDPRDGIRAIARILLNYQKSYNLKTIRQIINRWAPPKENNTNAYIEHVAKSMGIGPDQSIQLANDKRLLFHLTKSIILHENGFNPYHDQTIMEGVESSSSSNRPWADTKNMPVSIQSPKERIEGIPQNFVPPFESKQTDVFKRTAQFKYAFNNIDRVQARIILYQVINEVGANWKEIARILKKRYNLSPESMKMVNHEFLKDMASFASGRRWKVKYSQVLLPTKDIPDHLFKAISLHVGGNWRIINQRTFTDEYYHQGRGSLELIGQNIKTTGDKYYVGIQYQIRRSHNVPRLEWGEPTPEVQTEELSSYNTQTGHSLLSFTGFIEGTKGPNGPRHEKKPRIFDMSPNDERYEMTEIGSFGDQFSEKDGKLTTVLENRADTPYEVAQHIKDAIDRFWSDWDNNENEPVPEPTPQPRITQPVA